MLTEQTVWTHVAFNLYMCNFYLLTKAKHNFFIFFIKIISIELDCMRARVVLNYNQRRLF